MEDLLSKQVVPGLLDINDTFVIRTKPDGSCLPHVLSRFAYGNQGHPKEMRVRIVYELFHHIEDFLDDEYIETGLLPEAKPMYQPLELLSVMFQ